MRPLTPTEAEQFAMMLLSGAPVSDAVRYFLDPMAPEDLLVEAAGNWPAQPEVL